MADTGVELRIVLEDRTRPESGAAGGGAGAPGSGVGAGGGAAGSPGAPPGAGGVPPSGGGGRGRGGLPDDFIGPPEPPKVPDPLTAKEYFRRGNANVGAVDWEGPVPLADDDKKKSFQSFRQNLSKFFAFQSVIGGSPSNAALSGVFAGMSNAKVGGLAAAATLVNAGMTAFHAVQSAAGNQYSPMLGIPGKVGSVVGGVAGGIAGAFIGGPIGAALGASLGSAVLGGIASAPEKLTETFLARGKELSGYDASLARSYAMSEVRSTLADIREAQQLGPQMAQLNDSVSKFIDDFREMILPLKRHVIESLTFIVTSLHDLLKFAAMITGQDLPSDNKDALEAELAKLASQFFTPIPFEGAGANWRAFPNVNPTGRTQPRFLGGQP